MAASVMNYHGGSSLRLTGGITKSRTKIVSRLELANPKKLKNARKMLFGPVDREETRRLVETQLKRHVVDASSRWSFDFSTDQPIRSPDSKYVWERIPQLDDRLAMSPTPDNGPGPVMTLSSAAHMRTIQVVAGASSPSSRSASSSANSSLVSSPSTSMCHSDLETDMEVSGRVSGISTGDLNAAGSSNDGAATKRMVQKKMTDFMKEKKRTNPVLATVAKKRDLAGISTAAGLSASAVSAVTGAQGDDSSSCSWGADMPPAKRMRTGSVGSTSSVGSSS